MYDDRLTIKKCRTSFNIEHLNKYERMIIPEFKIRYSPYFNEYFNNSFTYVILNYEHTKDGRHLITFNADNINYNYEEMKQEFKPLAEEIIKAAWHPRRVTKWIEQDFDISDF